MKTILTVQVKIPIQSRRRLNKNLIARLVNEINIPSISYCGSGGISWSLESRDMERTLIQVEERRPLKHKKDWC